MTNFENVSISTKHFKNERDHAYSNPGAATWREHVQNAVDAIVSEGRSVTGNIHIYIDKLSDNVTRLEVADNGTGMTEETIRNVFMRLGESTKAMHGSQSGGFGRARILTHFSQHKYHIFTRDLHVVGKADRFAIKTIKNPRDYVAGCRMIVYVENLDRWGDAIDWKAELTSFLSKCQLPCQVFINDERWTTWTYRRQASKTLSLGTIHTNFSDKVSSNHNRLLVRVNGVYMFHEYLDLPGQVLFEIDPSKSRDVLTSNRDGFNSQCRQEWQKFIEELQADFNSATKDESNKIIEIEGDGGFDHYAKDTPILLVQAFGHTGTNNEHSSLPSQENVVGAVVNPMTEIVQPQTDDAFREDSFAVPSLNNNPGWNLSINAVPSDRVITDLRSVPSQTNAEAPSCPSAPTDDVPVPPKPKPIKQSLRNRLFSIVVNDNTACFEETQRRVIRRQMKDYNPNTWCILRYPDRPAKVVGWNKAKVLLLWKTICHFVVEEYLDLKGVDKIEWGVGWLFGPDAAEHRSHKDRHWLLVNPLNSCGHRRWELHNEHHRIEMLILAIHQVVHISHLSHDERFLNLSEKLTVRLFAKLPEIRRTLKKIAAVQVA